MGCTAIRGEKRAEARNKVVVLLSAKAGLRAGEIANLTWSMVLDANEHVGETIELHYKAAKKGSGRSIPIHPKLRNALARFAAVTSLDGFVIRSERGGPMTPLSIVVWFNRAFETALTEGQGRALSGHKTAQAGRADYRTQCLLKRETLRTHQQVR